MSSKAEMINMLDEIGHKTVESNVLVAYLLSRGFAKLDCTFADLHAGIRLCEFLTSDSTSVNAAGSIDDIKDGIRKIKGILVDILRCKNGG